MSRIKSKARTNPIGKYFPGVIPVIVGQGKFVHIYDPDLRLHICRSGKNAGKPPRAGEPDTRASRRPVYYQSKSKHITCWRCLKLAYMNLHEGREPWESR